MRLLIAEDEWLVATTLRYELESLGHEIVGIATTGADAVDLCRRERPDLVLMDIQMPQMNGLEATRILMAESPVCVVVVTGRARLESACEQAGAMAHVMKPLLAPQIPAVLSEALCRFDRFKALAAAYAEPTAALQAWVVVRRAAWHISATEDVSEEQAFERVLRHATERGDPPDHVAREVLGAAHEC